MKFSKILKDYTNREQGHEREIGRYWASDIYAIKKGYLTPENFFEKREIDLQGCRLIESGNMAEAHLEKIFNELGFKHQYQPKKEIQIDDFVLVVVPDFSFDNFILETKYPYRETLSIPEKWQYQLEAEYRAFSRQVLLGIFEYPFYLRTIEYTPSKERWDDIKSLLREFNKKFYETRNQN